VVGGVIAMSYFCGFRPVPMLLTVMVALGVAAFQAAENVLNDYFDTARGVDAPGAPGVMTRPHSFYGLGIDLGRLKAFGVSLFAFGSALVAIATLAFDRPLLPLFLAVGAFLLFCYSGPVGLKYMGLGELDVFITAVLMVVGAAYAVSGALSLREVALSLPMAFITSSVVLADNIRDYEWDRAHGVRTLPVRIGRAAASWLYAAMVLTSLLLPAALLWPWGLLTLAVAPAAVPAVLTVLGVRSEPLLKVIRYRFYVTVLLATAYSLAIALSSHP
jgi:1,4-dihydroxy-2-naphthoate octaprenyltransferase